MRSPVEPADCCCGRTGIVSAPMAAVAASKWSAEEDNALRALWPRGSRAQIEAAFPGRTHKAIDHRSRKLRVQREIGGEWTVAELALLRDLWPSGSKSEITEAFPIRTWEAIKRKASLHNVLAVGNPRLVVAPVFVRDGVPGKACVMCLEWKPLERFSRHGTCAGGRRNKCTTCEGRWKYANHREASIATVRKYQKTHPEAHRIRKRAADRKRRGQSYGPGVSAAEYRKIIEVFAGLCAYCGGKADTMDHVIPLSRGGEHSASNLVPACKPCNFSKHNKTPEEWRGREV